MVHININNQTKDKINTGKLTEDIINIGKYWVDIGAKKLTISSIFLADEQWFKGTVRIQWVLFYL